MYFEVSHSFFLYWAIKNAGTWWAIGTVAGLRFFIYLVIPTKLKIDTKPDYKDAELLLKECLRSCLFLVYQDYQHTKIKDKEGILPVGPIVIWSLKGISKWFKVCAIHISMAYVPIFSQKCPRISCKHAAYIPLMWNHFCSPIHLFRLSVNDLVFKKKWVRAEKKVSFSSITNGELCWHWKAWPLWIFSLILANKACLREGRLLLWKIIIININC